MIYIAELNKTKAEHQVVNSCMISILCSIANKENISTLLFTSQNHYDSFRDLSSKIETIILPVVDAVDGDKLNWAKKVLGEIKNTFQLLFKAKKNDVSLIYFLSISPITLASLTLFKWLFFRKLKIIITLHGELQYLSPGYAKKKVEILFKKLLLFCLRNKTQGLSYLVFGHSIYRSLEKYININIDDFIIISHPYNYQSNFGQKKNNHIVFSHIGACNKQKNSAYYMELANNISPDYTNIEFRAIGKVYLDSNEISPKVILIGQNQFLNRSLYEDAIQGTHWAIYIYEDVNYEMVSSGAILDAISFNIPIICVCNSYFKNIFEEYQIGILVKDKTDLEKVIKDIMENVYDKRFYNYCISEIQRFKASNSIEAIEKSLYNIFKQKALL